MANRDKIRPVKILYGVWTIGHSYYVACLATMDTYSVGLTWEQEKKAGRDI